MIPNPFRAAKIVIVVSAIFVIVCFVLMYLIHADNAEEEPVDLKADFKDDITHVEGKRYEVYFEKISAKLHAGIGHKLTREDLQIYTRGDAVTEEQIQTWFEQDYTNVLTGVKHHFPDFDTYPHLVQLALMNFLFQLGEDAPNKFPRATQAIHDRDWNLAADEWIYSVPRVHRFSRWYHQTPQRCLQEANRLREAAKE